MTYHDLNRRFSTAYRNEDDYSYLLTRNRGQLTWEDLLESKLVVVLASASSGKTYEFKGQAHELSEAEKMSVFIAIEELATSDIELLLPRATRKEIETWRQTKTLGYFFLDSVDEAKLKSKADYLHALRKLEVYLGDKLADSHIFISCRPSDWDEKEDSAFIENLFRLPSEDDVEDDTEQGAEPLSGNDLQEAVLARVSERHSNNGNNNAQSDKSEDKRGLKTVVLQPLSGEQQRDIVAKHSKVNDAETFFQGIANNGLEPFAKRPGDLLNLAGYWTEHGRFDSLSKMTDAGISRMLSEEKSGRADGDKLNPKKARDGAERLAAALTLGGTLTLSKPGNAIQNEDREPAVRASEVLQDWSEAEIETLLRRGLFAAASFGAVRFQHRSSVQYLTARYLFERAKKPGGRKAVHDILFREAFGVKTVVPELRPAAAWMSLWDDRIRDEVTVREPYELVRHGDPKSLDLTTRKALLKAYATAQAAGDVADDSIDHRAIWSFADKSLSDEIRSCWALKEEFSLRFFLIRLIEEGEIHECADLVKSVALSSETVGGKRSLALRCLVKLGEDSFVRSVAEKFVKGTLASNESESTITSILETLFPAYLSVDEYEACLRMYPKTKRDSYSGLSTSVPGFVQACPDDKLQAHLDMLARLVTEAPHKSHYKPLSKNHGYIAKNLMDVVAQNFARGKTEDLQKSFAKLVIIGSVGEYEYSSAKESRNFVVNLLKDNISFRRDCFLADVELAKSAPPKDGFMKNPWRMRLSVIGGPIYVLTESDIDWLTAIASDKSAEAHFRLAAFYSILQILQRAEKVELQEVELRDLGAFNENALKWLDECFSPPKKSKEWEKYERDERKREKQLKRKDLKNAASWITYRRELQKSLPDETLPTSLKGRAWGMISDLTRFIQMGEESSRRNAARGWRDLIPFFGVDVAKRYATLMKQTWRVVPAKRPKHKGNSVTTKWTVLWAFQGIGVEADADPDWLSRLSDAEVTLVCQHLFRDEDHVPDWMPNLLEKRWDIAKPLLRDELKREWRKGPNSSRPFLSHYANEENFPSFEKVAALFFSVVLHNDPGDSETWGQAARILTRFELSDSERNRLLKRVNKRLNIANEPIWIQPGLIRLLFWLSPEDALAQVEKALTNGSVEEAENIFSQLFAGNLGNGTALPPNKLPLSVLKKLVHLGYQHIRVEDDEEKPEGSYTPTRRHNAEDGRGFLFSMLLGRGSEDAYQAVRTLAATFGQPARKHWTNLLSKRMIERQVSLKAWSEKQSFEFHETLTAPILTGEDFFRLVVETLEAIERDMQLEDASSRAVALEAKSEDDIRDWLMEQIRLRIGQSATSVRESHVARKKRPDILVISRDVEADVVIEVKHGGKGWSLKGYMDTLFHQLSKRYLRVERRRHGILFISVHREDKYWIDPDTKKHVFFPRLRTMLDDEASRITASNAEGWTLKVTGIDFTAK